MAEIPSLDATETTSFADLLAQALATRGVTHAFGMPGGATLPILHALDQVGITFVLVRHEGSAAFMADAAYHITQCPGLCIATLGPGATNLVSGVAGSFLERSRVIAVTSQIDSEIRDTYTHQIIDHIEIFRPITRRAVHLQRDAAAMQLMTALAALERQRPGPILLDIPTDVTRVEVPAVDPQWGRSHATPTVPSVEEAAAILRRAKRPVIAVGCGELTIPAANGVRRLQNVANAVGITTYRAAGMLDEGHPLWGGCFGLSPVVDAHQQALLQQADLLIAVGLDMVELRPNWLPGWPDSLPIIAVDPHGQPDLMGNLVADLRGPMMETLDALTIAAFEGESGDEPVGSIWEDEKLAEHRHAWRAPFFDGPDGPAATIHAVQRASPETSRFCLDVGAHRITASHVLRVHFPNQVLQSNGFSSMGFGLPAAISARLIEPDRPVVAITGDAGLWMTLGELGIVQERSLDMVVVYLSDATLSLIQLKQTRAGLPDNGVRFSNPKVTAIADAFGGVGVQAQGAKQVEEAVRKAHQRGGLTIIEALIDPASYQRQM